MVMTETATILRRTLDNRRTAMVLARALQARAIVSIEAQPGNAELTWRGEVVDLDKSTIVLLCDVGDTNSSAHKRDEPLNAEFSLSSARYTFRTSLIDAPARTEDGQLVVRLKRPQTIAAIERRRSRRRFLSTGTVQIRVSDGGKSEPLQGVILNLSVNGLACRMTQADADRLTVGAESLTVMIQPGVSEGPDQLELCGHVVNITPAGSEEQAIVGVEFLLDEVDPWVRDALAGVVTRAGMT